MRPKKDDRAVRFNIPQRPRYAPIQVKVFEQAIEEGVRHQTRLKEQIERGEFEEGGDTSDLAFMAEVRDTLRYFDEKESGAQLEVRTQLSLLTKVLTTDGQPISA